MTPLDRLLQSLDPSRTLTDTAARADRALLAFHPPSARIERWDDYCILMTQLCLHLEREILRLPAHYEGDPEFEWAKGRELLNQAFGPNGYKTGFDMARSGQGGGLYAVMKTISARIAEVCSKREIAARVWSFVNGLTADERIAATLEYADKWSHLISLEFLEGGAIRLIDNFPEILQQHPFMVQRMQRVGK